MGLSKTGDPETLWNMFMDVSRTTAHINKHPPMPGSEALAAFLTGPKGSTAIWVRDMANVTMIIRYDK
jgi:hypothetical protein